MQVQWKQEAGKPPAKRLLKEASKLAKPNSATHIVVAMAMRPNGVTQQEVIALFGRPHRNKLRQLIQTRKVKPIELPEGTRSRRIKLVTNGVVVPRQA